MKINLKLFTIIFFSLACLAGPVVQAASLKDAFKTDVTDGSQPLTSVAGQAGYVTDPNSNTPEAMISQIIMLALSFLGVVFLGLTIYAGYLWMTAQGNQQEVDKAKKILTQAVIGLIVIITSYSISYYVISNLGSSQLKNIDENSAPK